MSPLTLCSTANLVTTEEECQLAATNTGYNYHSSGDWRDSWDFSGCQRIGDNVYLNTNSDLSPNVNDMKANYIAVCKEKTVAGINIEKVLPYYQAVQSSTSEGSTWLYQPKGKCPELAGDTSSFLVTI